MASIHASDQMHRGRMPTLFFIVFLSLVGFGVVLPVFPFIGLLVGATPAETTLAIAMYSLGQFVGAPLWGKLSDRYGRKRILVFSLLANSASYIVLAYAQDIITLGSARLIGGLMAGNIAAAFAYVGDVTDEASRPRAMGMLGAAFGLGFIFGPAVGGLIAGSETTMADLQTIGLLSAAITASAALATILFLDESLTPERRARAIAEGLQKQATLALLSAKPVVGSLMLLNLLFIGAAALLESSFPFYASDIVGWGPMRVGIAFAGLGLVSALLQGLAAGPLARRFGSDWLVMAGIAAYALGLLAIIVIPSEAGLIFGLVLVAMAIGLFSPAYQTLVANQSNDADRGLIMGLTQGASSMGRVIGPSVAGLVYQSTGPSSPYMLGVIVMIGAFLAAYYSMRMGKKRLDRANA